jgi:hypothetical protein
VLINEDLTDKGLIILSKFYSNTLTFILNQSLYIEEFYEYHDGESYIQRRVDPYAPIQLVIEYQD